MLQQVGFFDSTRIYADRFDVLANALRQATPATGDGLSLLVLPELFNLTEPYWPKNPGPNRILRSLFPEAYCIVSNSPVTLMCRKMNDDGSNNYTASALYDPDNPLKRVRTCVGALICLDALDCREETPEARARRNRLLDAIRGSQQQHRVLCVPAHMSSHCMPEAARVTLIVASSGGLGSFVRPAAQKPALNGKTRGTARSALCPPLGEGRTQSRWRKCWYPHGRRCVRFLECRFGGMRRWALQRNSEYTSKWINSVFQITRSHLRRKDHQPNSRVMITFWVDPGRPPYTGHGKSRTLGQPPRVVLKNLVCRWPPPGQ